MDWISYILYLLVPFIITLGATLILIRISHRYSLLDLPSKHKRHNKPTPNLGGIAVFISIWVTIAVFVAFKGGQNYPEINAYLPYIAAGSLFILIIGIIDDLKPVSAWAKLLVQIIAGLILYFGGLKIELLSLPWFGSTAIDSFSIIITVFWVVALSNAVNIIDGLDGLATGVSGIAAAAMAIIAFIYQIESVILLGLTMTGTFAAFLIFNRYPAKVFLGDSGALLIGYFFAIVSLVVPIKSFTTAALFVPLVVLGVPLTEIGVSFFRRLIAGKNVMKADRRHIFHYLAYAGLSPRKIVYLFYLSGLFFGAISIAMSLYNRILVLTILILFMVVIFIIYLIFIGRIRKGPLIRNGG